MHIDVSRDKRRAGQRLRWEGRGEGGREGGKEGGRAINEAGGNESFLVRSCESCALKEKQGSSTWCIGGKVLLSTAILQYHACHMDTGSCIIQPTPMRTAPTFVGTNHLELGYGACCSGTAVPSVQGPLEHESPLQQQQQRATIFSLQHSRMGRQTILGRKRSGRLHGRPCAFSLHTG